MAAFPISLAVAALLAFAGLAVLALRPQRLPNAWLAALLLLQAASTAAYAALAAATRADEATLYARLGVWSSLPLPLVTVCLAHALLAPPRWARALTLTLAAVTAAAVVAQVIAPQLYVTRVAPLSLGGYTLTSGPLFYVVAIVSALSSAYAVRLAERGSVHDAALLPRAGFISVAFALLPLHTAAFFLSYSAFRPEPLLQVPYLSRVVGTWIAAALIVVSLLRLARRAPRRPVRHAAALLGGLAILGVLDGIVLWQPGLAGALPGYERSVVLLRVAFAALMIVAAVRFGMADVGDRERRHARAVSGVIVAVLGGAAAAGLLVGALGPNALGFAVASVAVVLIPLAVRVPAARAGAALAHRLLLPPSDPRAVAERARTYAAAVAAARADDGRILPEGEKLLAQMRADLGISEQEHELLLSGVASREQERYRSLETLGRGSTAQVELAMDEVAGKRVVVKRFTGLRDPAAVLKEARSLAAVRHPRVVPFLQVDRRGDDVYLVLAYAEGGSARQLLDREGPLAPERALALTRDLLEGLEALHAMGLVHCDVKPENLLLDAEGRGMLGDFGSATWRRGADAPAGASSARFVAPDLADATLTGAGAEGSLSTVSPEALRSAPPHTTRDVYAAGALLYRLLTGEHYVDLADATVFEARERILMDAPRLPHARVPATVEPVLRKALAKRPAERYQSAREMLDALTPAARARA